uniref:Glutathione S-transferase n=1 Tax=Populus trichocarpa TaxID=3694 RepID=D2X9S6_POPTR|nr:tau class glutathione transferase GSTU42 [Populus trichocarpa]
MADEVTLLNFWASSEQDLSNGKSDLLLQMNPVYKKIPVLVHRGKPVCESLIILQYIDDVWRDKAPLLPSDPYERAQSMFWADFIDKKVITFLGRYGQQKEKNRRQRRVSLNALSILEGELGEKPYFGGETLGYGILPLLPFCCGFSTYETIGNFSIEAQCPKIIAWANGCLQKESVSKSLAEPGKVHELLSTLFFFCFRLMLENQRREEH